MFIQLWDGGYRDWGIWDNAEENGFRKWKKCFNAPDLRRLKALENVLGLNLVIFLGYIHRNKISFVQEEPPLNGEGASVEPQFLGLAINNNNQ